MSRFRRTAVAALSAAALAATIIPAGADSAVAFNDLSAEANGVGVTVEGRVDITADPVVIGTDAAEGIPGAVDLVEASITNLGRSVVFSLTTAGPNAGTTAPAVPHYLWDLPINGADIQLQAINSSANALTVGEIAYQLQTCAPDPQTSQNTCTGVDVPGDFDGTTLSWTIRLSELGLKPGDTIPGSQAYVSPGAAGLVWFTSGAAADIIDGSPYTIPSTTVTLTGVGDGGEFAGRITVTASDRGEFSGILPAGIASVYAEATYDGATATTWADVE